MAKNNKTRFSYVLYFDKTRVFDQSERVQYPIYIILWFMCKCVSCSLSLLNSCCTELSRLWSLSYSNWRLDLIILVFVLNHVPRFFSFHWFCFDFHRFSHPGNQNFSTGLTAVTSLSRAYWVCVDQSCHLSLWFLEMSWKEVRNMLFNFQQIATH